MACSPCRASRASSSVEAASPVASHRPISEVANLEVARACPPELGEAAVDELTDLIGPGLEGVAQRDPFVGHPGLRSPDIGGQLIGHRGTAVRPPPTMVGPAPAGSRVLYSCSQLQKMSAAIGRAST